jgi:RNA polymerase sigma factor, sigma-70 family
MPKTTGKPDIERIVSLYGTALLRMAFLYLKDMHLAEDAVQETFLRVLKYYDNYREEASEKTWIYRIAINICKDISAKSWWKRIDYDASYEQIEDCREQNGGDSTISVEIMKLPPKYKQVVLLYYYMGFSLKETGGILGISESAAAMRLSRAREQLKKSLKGWYEE